jgi:glutaminyl-peptide cyclotransferase
MRALEVDRFIRQSFPHDESSFCQGLIVHGSLLYESAGWYGQSRLQVSSWPPGPSSAPKYRLMDNEFGEDLALVHHAGHLLQGTWLEGYVIVWSLRPLERVGTIGCDEREMWGLAYARDRDASIRVMAMSPS